MNQDRSDVLLVVDQIVEAGHNTSIPALIFCRQIEESGTSRGKAIRV